MEARPENPTESNNANRSRYKYLSVAGITLIAGGGLLLLDQILQTTWLSLLALPVVGGILLAQGIHTRQMNWYIPGSLAFFFGLGIVAGFGAIFELSTFQKVGVLLLAFSQGWTCIALIAHFRVKERRLVGAHSRWLPGRCRGHPHTHRDRLVYSGSGRRRRIGFGFTGVGNRLKDFWFNHSRLFNDRSCHGNLPRLVQ